MEMSSNVHNFKLNQVYSESGHVAMMDDCGAMMVGDLVGSGAESKNSE